MQNSQWVVDGSSPNPTKKKVQPDVEKHPFVTIIKISDEMDEHQKKFFGERNSLVEFVKKLGLMESK